MIHLSELVKLNELETSKDHKTKKCLYGREPKLMAKCCLDCYSFTQYI